MGRYKAFRPRRMVSSNLATGGQMNFYEPDQLLSETMSPKKALVNEVAIRETAWNYYRVLGFLPNPSETLRRLSKDIAEYKYLLEDAYVNGVLSSRKAGTLNQQWTLDRGDTPIRQYNTLKDLFDGWDVYSIMSEMLNCLWFGYQPVEVIWERVGGLILPSEVVPKDPDWFRFSDLNELRYLTKRNMVTGEPVPPNKFLVSRYRPSYERPYGRPLASACYWPCKMRHSGFKFFTQFVEKFGQPWVSAKYPLGTQMERIYELVGMLDEGIQDNVLATPNERDVETLDVNKTSSAEIFKSFIELCNEEISIAVLSTNLTTKVKEGSFAAAKTHGDIRQDLVDEDRRIVESCFNTLIDWIYEMNWGSDVRPKFSLVFDKQPTKDDGLLAVALTQAGIKFTKEYFVNRFGLTEDEFDINEMALPGMTPATEEPGTGTDKIDTDNISHDVGDTAENNSTYESTKDAVKNLTRR